MGRSYPPASRRPPNGKWGNIFYGIFSHHQTRSRCRCCLRTLVRPGDRRRELATQCDSSINFETCQCRYVDVATSRPTRTPAPPTRRPPTRTRSQAASHTQPELATVT
eukprot:485486-Rhodomonas_salina.1